MIPLRNSLFSTLLCIFAISNIFSSETCNKWTPELMMKVRNIGDIQISPGNRKVAYTVTSADMDKNEYISQIFVTDIDGKNSYPLTNKFSSCLNPRWSPDGKTIAFLSRRTGSNNIWLIRTNGGEAWQLTDVKQNISGLKWSPKGDKIAFVMQDLSEEEETAIKDGSNVNIQGDCKMSHIWLISVDPKSYNIGTVSKLTSDDFTIEEIFGINIDWAPDGKSIVFSHKTNSALDNSLAASISIVDVSNNKLISLVSSDGGNICPLYSPDGKWISYLHLSLPYQLGWNIYIVPSNGGISTKLTSTPDEMPFLLSWASNSKSIYFFESYKTVNGFYSLPINGALPVRMLGNTQRIDSVTVSSDSSMFAFVGQAWNQAEEVFASKMQNPSPEQISRVNEDLPNLPLGKTEIINWGSTDGVNIEGVLTYPVNYDEGKKYPLVLLIHGGPEDPAKNSFLPAEKSYPVAVYSANGYFVLRPNYRGSGGYGAEFLRALLKNNGIKDYQDIMTGVDYAITHYSVDSDRMVVAGYSYGGYLTAWIVTQSQCFKTACVGAGMTNLISLSGTTDLNFMTWYLGCEFFDNYSLYIERSPISHVKGVVTPTLIQHGLIDKRIPVGQSLELYSALNKQGIGVKMIGYPNCTHDYYSPKLSLIFMKDNLEWIEKHLK